MKREDFIFTIGYQGASAIVDGQAKKKYGKLHTFELAEKGLYKPAFCSALYAESEEELDKFAEFFSRKVIRDDSEESGKPHFSVEGLKRLFGVFEVPEGIEKVIVI